MQMEFVPLPSKVVNNVKPIMICCTKKERIGNLSALKYLATLFSVYFLLSLVVISLHHHANLRDYSNCSICKVVRDLPPAGNAPSMLAVPEMAAHGFFYETVKHLMNVTVDRLGSRSPPLLSSPAACKIAMIINELSHQV